MRPLVVGYKQFGRNCHPHIPTEVGQLGKHLGFVCVCVCVHVCVYVCVYVCVAKST